MTDHIPDPSVPAQTDRIPRGPRFLRLTSAGVPLAARYVRADSITKVASVGGGSSLRIAGDDDWTSVTETPDEILALLDACVTPVAVPTPSTDPVTHIEAQHEIANALVIWKTPEDFPAVAAIIRAALDRVAGWLRG